MKLRRNKKGFTIIELVIVIAVIGILAAVLIPTFVNLTNKANEASDNALVNNLNKALKMEEQEPGHKKAETLEGAIIDLENQGYLLENLASKSGKDLLWSQSQNQFLLNTENKSGKDYWKIVDAVPAKANQKYSYYAGKNFNQTDVTVAYGFDAGRNDDIAKVTYEGAGSAQEVAIRTNSEETDLEVNAPLDTVHHYDDLKSLNVTAIKGASYHEHGIVKGNAIIASGRLVVEKDGVVPTIIVDNTNKATGATAAPEVKASTGSEVGTIVVNTVSTGTKVEVETGADVSAVAAGNETAKAAMATVAKDVPAAIIEENVVDTSKTSLFEGGLGTETSPYLISNKAQFENINSLSSDMCNGKSLYFVQTADIDVTASIENFAGEYDGGGYKLSSSATVKSSKNINYLFGDEKGHVTLKNINVHMNSDYATVLLYTADWDTAYGLDVENVSFNAEQDIEVNIGNFGFVLINPIYTSEDSEVTYNFKNIINNVNVTNASTSTGFIVGSGPCINGTANFNYENCVNNGKICGTENVGFLYGNPSYLDSGELNFSINNCVNNGTFMSVNSTANVHFAPVKSSSSYNNKDIIDNLNDAYETGLYMASNALSKTTVKISQSGSTFTVNTTATTAYTYKMALHVGTVTHADGTVSNGTKYLFDVEISSDDNGYNTFHAYDLSAAISKGIIASESEVAFGSNNAGIVVKDGMNYLIIKFYNGDTADSSVSVSVYAYSGDTLVGVK